MDVQCLIKSKKNRFVFREFELLFNAFIQIINVEKYLISYGCLKIIESFGVIDITSR